MPREAQNLDLPFHNEGRNPTDLLDSGPEVRNKSEIQPRHQTGIPKGERTGLWESYPQAARGDDSRGMIRRVTWELAPGSRSDEISHHLSPLG